MSKRTTIEEKFEEEFGYLDKIPAGGEVEDGEVKRLQDFIKQHYILRSEALECVDEVERNFQYHADGSKCKNYTEETEAALSEIRERLNKK